MEIREIEYRDKTKNKVTIYTNNDNNGITLIFLPAMGVKVTFYKIFAKQLSEKGFNVILVDWRGQGKSSIRASRKTNFGYEDIIEDLKELMQYANSWFPRSKKMIVGHSLGGQIGSLYSSRYDDSISGLILITSSSVYYKGWEKWNAVKIQIAGKLFYPISKIFGYFPGNVIGFGGKEAKNVMKDWCFNAVEGEYRLTNSKFNYENSLSKFTKHVLSISVENDDLASKKSVENLYNKFNSEAKVLHLHLNSDETGISPLDHFSWARDPKYFIEIIAKWVRDDLEN